MNVYKSFYVFSKNVLTEEKITEQAANEQTSQLRSALSLMEILLSDDPDEE